MKLPTRLLSLAAAALFVLASVSACTNGAGETADNAADTTTTEETRFDLETAKSKIITNNNRFAAFYNARDSAGVASLYTPDAKFMMNGAPAIFGRGDIESVISDIMNSGISRVKLETVEVWGAEDYVTEEGAVTLWAGDEVADQGKYMVLWKKLDGDWYLHRDIFNSNLPAE